MGESNLDLTFEGLVAYVDHFADLYGVGPSRQSAAAADSSHYQISLTSHYDLNTLLNISRRYGQFGVEGYLNYTDGIDDKTWRPRPSSGAGRASRSGTDDCQISGVGGRFRQDGELAALHLGDAALDVEGFVAAFDEGGGQLPVAEADQQGGPAGEDAHLPVVRGQHDAAHALLKHFAVGGHDVAVKGQGRSGRGFGKAGFGRSMVATRAARSKGMGGLASASPFFAKAQARIAFRNGLTVAIGTVSG